MAQNTMGNVYGNQGIITQGQTGNNTIIQAPPARNLDSPWGGPLKSQILEKLPRDQEISVTAVLGDAEAADLAVQIYNFLKNNGFKMKGEGINQAIFTQVPHGLSFVTDRNDFVVGAR